MNELQDRELGQAVIKKAFAGLFLYLKIYLKQNEALAAHTESTPKGVN